MSELSKLYVDSPPTGKHFRNPKHFDMVVMQHSTEDKKNSIPFFQIMEMKTSTSLNIVSVAQTNLITTFASIYNNNFNGIALRLVLFVFVIGEIKLLSFDVDEA